MFPLGWRYLLFHNSYWSTISQHSSTSFSSEYFIFLLYLFQREKWEWEKLYFLIKKRSLTTPQKSQTTKTPNVNHNSYQWRWRFPLLYWFHALRPWVQLESRAWEDLCLKRYFSVKYVERMFFLFLYLSAIIIYVSSNSIIMLFDLLVSDEHVCSM